MTAKQVSKMYLGEGRKVRHQQQQVRGAGQAEERGRGEIKAGAQGSGVDREEAADHKRCTDAV